jgi:AbrB family looped-hinge helix DNA binding protein
MPTVTVSRKFQVVIPRDVRRSPGITVGQKIRVLALGDRIQFIPIRPVKALRGFVRGINPTVRRDKDRM